MTNLKFSKQRNAIEDYLKTSVEHPTANHIYTVLRQQYPNISLGTVYRNLRLLSDSGKIQRMDIECPQEHYDGRIHPHYHFICRNCESIFDLDFPVMHELEDELSKNSSFTVERHTLHFYGICENCKVKV